MIWLHSQDEFYFQKEQIEKLKEEYKISEILITPTQEEITIKLRNFEKFAVLSYYDVPRGSEGFFVYIRLKPRFEVLTSQQKKYNISETEALYHRYGVKVLKPNKDFSSYGGGHGLKKWFNFVQGLKTRGLPVKPIFLLGVQGAGKSEFVICYAGETKSVMVDLNLSLIMEDMSPLKKLNEVFEFISDTKLKATIRIDEITEMLSNKFLFGEFLTLLNDLNTKDGYEINGELFASANRIDEINRTTPQFFRQGRWNKKFFMTYPTRTEAYEIMDLYSKMYKNNFSNEEIKRIYSRSEIEHRETSLPNLSPYTPAELNVLMLELTQYSEYDNELFQAHIKNFIPQTQTSMHGTYAIIQQQQELCFEVLNQDEMKKAN